MAFPSAKPLLKALSWPILCAGLVAPAGGSATDLHYFWDQRCADCHGHAGAFAREFLRVENGVLAGRHHTDDLRLFLGHHGVPAADVDAVYGMLLAQAGEEGRFAKRCGGCHQSAADLARESLAVENGELRGKRSGRAVRDFLVGHAGLSDEDAPYFADLLERVEREVHRP